MGVLGEDHMALPALPPALLGGLQWQLYPSCGGRHRLDVLASVFDYLSELRSDRT